MNVLLDNLLRILKAETRLYRYLQSILQKQRDAVVQCELNALEANGKKKEELLSQLTELEAHRTEVMAKLAVFLSVPQSDLTLKKTIRLIQNPYATALRGVRANLIDALQGVQQANQDNLSLFQHGQQLVKRSLALLNHCILKSYVYYPSGKIQNATPNGTILSGEI